MPDLRPLRLIAPAVRSRAASLAGAVALLVAYSAVAVSPALITQQLIDRGLAAGDVPLVAVLALALIVAAAASSALSVLAARVLAAAGVAADLRADLVRRVLDASTGWMVGCDDGYIAARVAEASSVSALFSKTSFTFASSVLQATGSAIAVAAMSPAVLALALLPVPAYAWCAARSLRAYRVSVAVALEANAGLTGRVAEAVSGREEVSSSPDAARSVAARVGDASERVRSSSVRRSVLAALTGEGMSLLSTASASFVYVACAALAGSLSVGRVVAAVQLAARVYSPFLVAVSAAITVQPALAALGRIAEAFPESPRRGGAELAAAPRTIELRNLAFRYDDGHPLLDGLTATLSRPSLVVVRGPNGSGKSTLLRILLGELTGWEGEVLVDGVSLGSISPESWRSHCAAVRQRPFLLNASLRENVLLGTEDSSEKAYRAALSASGLCDVSARLPEGDASPVGPAGSLLSGGERQRVAIARALLRGADVLLLDEPATGLDPAGKASLRDLLARLARERLVVVVDHEGVFDDVADQVIDL